MSSLFSCHLSSHPITSEYGLIDWPLKLSPFFKRLACFALWKPTILPRSIMMEFTDWLNSSAFSAPFHPHFKLSPNFRMMRSIASSCTLILSDFWKSLTTSFASSLSNKCTLHMMDTIRIHTRNNLRSGAPKW